jgi:hypothetical protein
VEGTDGKIEYLGDVVMSYIGKKKKLNLAGIFEDSPPAAHCKPTLSIEGPGSDPIVLKPKSKTGPEAGCCMPKRKTKQAKPKSRSALPPTAEEIEKATEVIAELRRCRSKAKGLDKLEEE